LPACKDILITKNQKISRINMQLSKTQGRIALCACLVTSAFGLFTAQPASAITWRSAFWDLTAANDFGRDHISFQGVGRNGGCTGNLIYQNNRILTAAHCPAGTSWTVRGNSAVTVSSSVAKSGQDVRLVKLSANSGGTNLTMWDSASETGTEFLKAGHGTYGDITSPGGSRMAFNNPLAGHNTYGALSTNTVNYNLKTTVKSVGTGPGDSGGPAIVKVGTVYKVSSTTTGVNSGGYVDSRASHARSWVLENL
jgi:hypothetical protein